MRLNVINCQKLSDVDCSPDGRKVKTKAQLARILGSKFDLAGFDFRTGRILSGGMHRRKCVLQIVYKAFLLSIIGYPFQFILIA